jgi:signal transduction histidine kinase
MLKSQSERLNALVQGILSLARLERDAERARLDFSRVDLTDIVCDVVERLRTAAEAKCLSVKADIPESCIAFCDAQLVDSAISNLLANAIRHSGSVEVFLSLSSSDGMFTVSVEDHGCGIPPEDRSRVFDRFYRVDRSRGIDTGGTGLGLAIVREVARIHGGDVRLEGVEPSGCRFLFSAKLNPDN